MTFKDEAKGLSENSFENIDRWLDVIQRSKFPALELANLVLGLRATGVIDVGARDAGVEALWWRLPGLANYFGFEPDPAECTRLNSNRDPNYAATEVEYFPVALGASSGEATLYLTENLACSSLYEPDPILADRFPDIEVTRKRGELRVPLSTLDEWWEKENRPVVGFVKLDTQGSELDILQGGSNLLAQCIGCEVEVEFSPMYKNQPLFHEVESHMRSRGFVLWRLYGLCHYPESYTSPHSRSENIYFGSQKSSTFQAGSGRLFWANAIYFRDHNSNFFNDNPKALFVLLALMEAARDFDGVLAVLKRIISYNLLPATAEVRLVAAMIPRSEDPNPPFSGGRETQASSLHTKAAQWDKFRGSLIGRVLGRFY